MDNKEQIQHLKDIGIDATNLSHTECIDELIKVVHLLMLIKDKKWGIA